MNINALDSIINLTKEEKIEIKANPEKYENAIEELLLANSDYIENLREINDLHSQMGIINFEFYEVYMKVHTNAIIMKATLTEMNMMGIRYHESEEVSRIFENYLLIKEFH